MTAPAGTTDDLATRAWNLMQQMVLNEDRRRKAATEVGMPFGRIRALRRIAASDGITHRELADSMSTDAAFVTVTVDDLAKRGLVFREPHADDRRIKLLRVTAAGAIAAAEADRVMSRPPLSLTALSARELATLMELLGKL